MGNKVFKLQSHNYFPARKIVHHRLRHFSLFDFDAIRTNVFQVEAQIVIAQTIATQLPIFPAFQIPCKISSYKTSLYQFIQILTVQPSLALPSSLQICASSLGPLARQVTSSLWLPLRREKDLRISHRILEQASRLLQNRVLEYSVPRIDLA